MKTSWKGIFISKYDYYYEFLFKPWIWEGDRTFFYLGLCPKHTLILIHYNIVWDLTRSFELNLLHSEDKWQVVAAWVTIWDFQIGRQSKSLRDLVGIMKFDFGWLKKPKKFDISWQKKVGWGILELEVRSRQLWGSSLASGWLTGGTSAQRARLLSAQCCKTHTLRNAHSVSLQNAHYCNRHNWKTHAQCHCKMQTGNRVLQQA